jgi:hypothetical protein
VSLNRQNCEPYSWQIEGRASAAATAPRRDHGRLASGFEALGGSAGLDLAAGARLRRRRENGIASDPKDRVQAARLRAADESINMAVARGGELISE